MTLSRKGLLILAALAALFVQTSGLLRFWGVAPNVLMIVLIVLCRRNAHVSHISERQWDAFYITLALVVLTCAALISPVYLFQIAAILVLVYGAFRLLPVIPASDPVRAGIIAAGTTAAFYLVVTFPGGAVFQKTIILEIFYNTLIVVAAIIWLKNAVT